MQKLITSLVIVSWLVIFLSPLAAAQKSHDSPIKRAKLPASTYRYKIVPVSGTVENGAVNSDLPSKDLSEGQKALLQQINDVYKMHVKSVHYEINNNPLDAEKYIRKALKAVQQMINTHPDIQRDKRFKELYRTIYTEYQSFYGIKKMRNRERGRIFAVHRELMEDKDEGMNGKFALPKNVVKPKTRVPLVYNSHVNRHLMFFSSTKPEVMQRWIDRSQKYFPMMKRIFREEELPPELVHMSMIESGLNPKARSWAAAVGMWQFIRPTAAMYGLEVNWWMDERRDPEKSTRAAARYLKDLYHQWGNWYLAMANYNLGPRGLKRAIRQDGGRKDYWAAYPYLPRETQGYVPSFIATTIIDRNINAFGFKRPKKHTEAAYSYDVAKVAPLMSLKKLARAGGISVNKLKQYNPELLRWATPPGGKYPLKLPQGTKHKFLANYNKIPKDQRSRGVAVHTVRRGETLGYIAQRYGSTVRAIYGSNKGLTHIIHPGQKIIVPLAPGSSKKIAVNKPTDRMKSRRRRSASRHRGSDRAHRGLKAVYYTVKPGDNIGYIAEWYDVRASRIRAWNHTSNTIHPGEKLKIYVPKDKTAYYRQVNSFSFSKKHKIERRQHRGQDVTKAYLASADGKKTVTYTVRPHDTLIEIAHRFGVSVHSIKRSNDLNGSRIYRGQKLKIHAN